MAKLYSKYTKRSKCLMVFGCLYENRDVDRGEISLEKYWEKGGRPKNWSFLKKI